MASPASPDPRDFFVSYNKADRKAAEWIAQVLDESGYTTIIQCRDFAPGSNFVLEMDAAVNQAKHTIAVLSPDFLASIYTKPEWAAAVAKDPTGAARILIPVRVRECHPRGLLGQISYIDLADLDIVQSEVDARQRLLVGIKKSLRHAGHVPTLSDSEIGQRNRQSGKRLLVVAAILAAVLAVIAYYTVRHTEPEVYRLRATVTDSQGTPVEDARVWSTIGGEPKKVAGGWEFTIPRATLPAHGNVTVFATVAAAFQKGQAAAHLDSDPNPAITISLSADTSATIRGTVVDPRQTPLAGASVSVAGHPQTSTTGADGAFFLPAHAASGQQVQLRATKTGYEPVTAWHPAGDTPAELVLERDGKTWK